MTSALSFCKYLHVHKNLLQAACCATVCFSLPPPHLCHWCCRVDYYFAQINTTTYVMTDLFVKEYAHSQNAVFKVMKHVDAASSFVPMVVASIRCIHSCT